MEKPTKPKAGQAKRRTPNVGWSPAADDRSEEARRARVKPAGSEGPEPRKFPASIQSAADGASTVGEAVGNLAKDVGLHVAAEVAIEVAIEGPKKVIDNISDVFS